MARVGVQPFRPRFVSPRPGLYDCAPRLPGAYAPGYLVSAPSGPIPHSAFRIPHCDRAFTLVELILALGVAVLASTAVAAMLVAVAYGTSSKRDLREFVVKGKTLDGRVAAAIRASRAVLETGTDYLILWTSDTRQNDAPDLSEIRLVERAGDNTLKSYGFPDTWTQAQIDAADVSYTLSGNPAGFFRTATTNAKTAGSFVSKLWGNAVTAVSFTLDASDPAVISLAAYRLTLQSGDLSETVIGSASVRYKELGGT